jgi:hypothetical protein
MAIKYRKTISVNRQQAVADLLFSSENITLKILQTRFIDVEEINFEKNILLIFHQ